MRRAALIPALLAIVAPGEPASAQSRPSPGTGGSLVPCAVPMAWSIVDIDSRFDLSEAWALQAARDAAALWEKAVGRELFRLDADGGHPVVFEFDARQAGVEERVERVRELDAERAGIERSRVELDEESGRYSAALERYQTDLEAHDRAVRAYNEDFIRWSRQDDVPRHVQAELERRRDELDRSSRDLRTRERELSRLSDRIRDEVDRFNARVDELRAREASLAGDYPASPSESGVYDENVSWQDGEAVSVTRRIRVFQFSGYDDLVLVLAHELGHALGLGHAPGGSAAVMSEVIMSGTGAALPDAVTEVDVSMLAGRCPSLVEGAR